MQDDTTPGAASLPAVEYRVTWRREGSAGDYTPPRMRSRIYQSYKGARRLADFLAQYMPADRDEWPCAGLYEDGECGCATCIGNAERVLSLSIETRRATAWGTIERVKAEG